MSAGWQAFFWLLALVAFVIDACGIIVTVKDVRIRVQSIGLALFTIPWMYTAWDVATK